MDGLPLFVRCSSVVRSLHNHRTRRPPLARRVLGRTSTVPTPTPAPGAISQTNPLDFLHLANAFSSDSVSGFACFSSVLPLLNRFPAPPAHSSPSRVAPSCAPAWRLFTATIRRQPMSDLGGHEKAPHECRAFYTPGVLCHSRAAPARRRLHPSQGSPSGSSGRRPVTR